MKHRTSGWNFSPPPKKKEKNQPFVISPCTHARGNSPPNKKIRKKNIVLRKTQIQRPAKKNMHTIPFLVETEGAHGVGAGQAYVYAP